MIYQIEIISNKIIILILESVIKIKSKYKYN